MWKGQLSNLIHITWQVQCAHQNNLYLPPSI